jgi:hypothetical protein
MRPEAASLPHVSEPAKPRQRFPIKRKQQWRTTMPDNINVGGGGGNTGLGLIAGILLAALVVFGLIFFVGGFNGGGDTDVNVKLDTPKVGSPRAGG